MNLKQFFFLLFPLLLFCSACEEEGRIQGPSDKPSKNKIMPLGASRVEGARPDFESFRYDLWKLMIDGAWEFDFIGTQNDPGSYPAYKELSFDVNHEGHSGWTSGQILDRIDNWLSTAGSPDIVLFSSPGGNDALDGLSYTDALANINAIIDAIQAANPNVTIIIEQMAGARSDARTPELETYFAQMQEDIVSIATQQTTNDSRVIAVNMFTDFTDAMLADEVHYNESGANFIANRYYDVLVNVLQP